ncbi:MAG: CBS domain-containing protein [Halobacteriales archaeon]
MPISDVARRNVVTASPDTTVPMLAKEMREFDVGSVVVVDDDEPVGIVTDRDLSVRVLAEAEGIEVGSEADLGIADLTAHDVMTHGAFAVDADDSVLEVLSDMCAENVRRVPVVEDGELAGIVTLDDFVALLATEFNNLASVIVKESPPYESS